MQIKNNKQLALVILISIIASCTNKTNTKKEIKEKTYPVIGVVTKDTVLQLRYVADIHAHKNVEIHARVPGMIEHIYVDEGQFVKKGQLLFKMSETELRIELDKANAALNSALADAKVAEVERGRVKLLVDKKVIASSEFDLADAKYNALLAKAEESRSIKASVQRKLSFTAIHSPFDGVIDRIPLKAGSLAIEGSLLTTISDIHAMRAYFNLSENEYLQLLQNQDSTDNNLRTVELLLADGSKYPHAGKIVASESEIDENTGSIAFRADFPNPEGLLKHGASGTLLITKPIKKAMLIPQKSVIEIQDKNYVYILGKDNIVKMHEFKPLRRLKDYYIVSEGLTGEETIVYEGIQLIQDGEKIIPEDTASK